MKLTLVIRLPDGRSYEKTIAWESEKPLPNRGQNFFIADLNADVPVHGVSGIGTDAPQIIFVRHLEIQDTHRIQSVGWKLQKA